MLKKLSTSLLIAAIAFPSVLVSSSEEATLGNQIAQQIKCNENGSTLEMRKCASDKYQVADKKLNQVYQQLSSQVKGEEKNRLIEAQRAWIVFRDKTCSFEAAQALGGTLEPLLLTSCLGRVTSERAATLEKYVSDRANVSSSDDPNFPKIARVKSLVSGDIMCYVTVVDENNKERQVGAVFEICAKQNQFLNQKVRLTYGPVNVNDCQSSEPCGKTRKETLVTKMEVIKP